LAIIDVDRKVGGDPDLTTQMSPRPRPTSVPLDIVIHSAVLPQ